TLSWRTCRTPSPPPPRRPPHHTPPTTVSERPRPRPPNSTLSHSQHHPSPHKVYHQERVEEVRTEQRSSGGGKMASLNNNLSELDTLLQDLNNARYTGVFKEPAAATNGTVNGSRPTVDSLLDALDDVDTGFSKPDRIRLFCSPIASFVNPRTPGVRRTRGAGPAEELCLESPF
ncbi:putative leupaxin isoform X2, partial [Penaeus vannamei]